MSIVSEQQYAEHRFYRGWQTFLALGHTAVLMATGLVVNNVETAPQVIMCISFYVYGLFMLMTIDRVGCGSQENLKGTLWSWSALNVIAVPITGMVFFTEFWGFAIIITLWLVFGGGALLYCLLEEGSAVDKPRKGHKNELPTDTHQKWQFLNKRFAEEAKKR